MEDMHSTPYSFELAPYHVDGQDHFITNETTKEQLSISKKSNPFTVFRYVRIKFESGIKFERTLKKEKKAQQNLLNIYLLYH